MRHLTIVILLFVASLPALGQLPKEIQTFLGKKTFPFLNTFQIHYQIKKKGLGHIVNNLGN